MRSSSVSLLRVLASAAALVSAWFYGSYCQVRSLFASPPDPVRSKNPQPSPAAQRPRVALVSAKAFCERLAKRDRPTVTERWRRCPSA